MNGETVAEPVDAEGESEAEAGLPEDRARSYDDDVRTVLPGYEVLHETVAALLRNELGDQARVLVVGVGTGEEILRLAPGNPGWRFMAEDPSGPMLSIAREKIASAGLADRVELFEGLVQDLPPAEPYDAATMILVQHFLPDDGAKLEILRAVAERLKPGAPLIMANMHGDLTAPTSQRLFQGWKSRQIARGMPRKDADEMFQGLPSVIHFVSEERIRQLLQEAGFTDIELVFKSFIFGGWLAWKDPEH